MCVLWSLPVLICNYWCAEFCASIIENLLVLHVNVRLARPVALTLCIDPFTDRELFRILPTLEDIGNFFRKIYFWTIYATNTSNICFNMLNLTIKYIWVKVLAILALKNKVLVNFIYQLFLPAPSWIWPIRERAYELVKSLNLSKKSKMFFKQVYGCFRQYNLSKTIKCLYHYDAIQTVGSNVDKHSADYIVSDNIVPVILLFC